ncbi:hypothetical protein FD21_GL002155 [Liquorilactobacillus vini DSM 20605]|uniref:Uncharacterized protein n=2 Tax=Liquorilactobacillus vini TaxID=238015 RepID=A0A0R2BYB1_9LACO|nr:hypothetical protein FD21_GL002155 [Liquorilactobacillus vini DSM 20605]
MKMGRNFRTPWIASILASTTITILGVIINNNLLSNLGSALIGITVLWGGGALTFFKHYELLAGASYPLREQDLKRELKLLARALGVLLILVGGYLIFQAIQYFR